MSAYIFRLPRWQEVTLRLDQPISWLALALVALAAAVPGQVGPSLEFIGGNLLRLGPVLLGSAALAAYLKAARSDALLRRAIGGHPAITVTGAALLGALSPFCSCGVVPIVAGLLAAKVPLAPIMAFWVSSPLMSPDMFLLTSATLGLPFAVAKTLAAIGIGWLGGMVTHGLVRSGALPLAALQGTGAVVPERPVWAVWRHAGPRSEFAGQFGQLTWKLAQWLAIAFLLESLMAAWLPAEMLAGWLGGGSAWGIPLATAIGIPAYLNGYAALPVTAGLLQAGMSPGAAMAFLVAGGVTSIPAIVAVRAVAERRVFRLYLVLAIAGSLLAGYAYELWTRI
jgi:hypothetical protein